MFNRYLPYVIVFDLTDHGVQTFAVAMAPAAGGRHRSVRPYYAPWFVGSGGFDRFDTSLSSFGSGVAATLASQSSSRGSGGGGFSVGGGGGVGSW